MNRRGLRTENFAKNPPLRTSVLHSWEQRRMPETKISSHFRYEMRKSTTLEGLRTVCRSFYVSVTLQQQQQQKAKTNTKILPWHSLTGWVYIISNAEMKMINSRTLLAICWLLPLSMASHEKFHLVQKGHKDKNYLQLKKREKKLLSDSMLVHRLYQDT